MPREAGRQLDQLVSLVCGRGARATIDNAGLPHGLKQAIVNTETKRVIAESTEKERMALRARCRWRAIRAVEKLLKQYDGASCKTMGDRAGAGCIVLLDWPACPGYLFAYIRTKTWMARILLPGRKGTERPKHWARGIITASPPPPIPYDDFPERPPSRYRSLAASHKATR